MPLPFTNPSVEESINRLKYRWADMDLLVIADRITDAGSTELWFYHSNGAGDKLLHTAKVNLLSSSTMTQLAKRMGNHSQDVPWQEVLTSLSARTVEYQRRGEPGDILKPIPGIANHPGYYIEPLLLKGLPNLIHGAKGANKTTLGLAALGICANGVYDSLTGLVASEEVRGVGILDWENDKDTTVYNISCLVEGGTVPYFEPAYLRCSLPLVDDVQRIADWIAANKLSLILIDSLGQAAGTDSFDSSGKRAALRFFQASRQLKVTTLIIGQESKNEEGKKTIYGSVYYQYYSRNIFELKATKDSLDTNVLHLALFHTDANFSALYEPMGFRTTYTPGSTSIESEPVKVSQFLERASQTNELLEFLKSGAKSVSGVVESMGITEGRARVMLTRAKKRGLVVSLGSGMWGLAAKED